MASFCRLMIDHHFTSKLQIPPEFVKNYEEIFTQCSKMMTLRTDDKLWRVGIQEIGNFHFFTKGWTKFAKEANLKRYNFVVFKLVEDSAFHVSVYDTTCCKKDSSYSDHNDGEMSSKAERKWRFSREVKNHHLMSQRMDFPKDFVVGTGLKYKGRIILEDGKGRKWGVKVSRLNNGSTYGMSGGWKKFAVANGAKVGSIVSYEFISGALVRARVINNN